MIKFLVKNSRITMSGGVQGNQLQNTSEKKDTQSRGKSLKENLLFLYQSESYVDVEFLVGPEDSNDRKVFKAHKLVLSSRSPVFDAMFNGPLAERKEQIVISDINPDIFSILIRYIYSDEVDLKNEIQAIGVCLAADKYMISSLKEICEAFLLSSELSADSVIQILELAVRLGENRLRIHCLNFVSQCAEKVLKSAEFLNLNLETLRYILQLKSIYLTSEMPIIEALFNWAKNAQKKESTVREILFPLLCYIDFESMESKELGIIVQNFPGVIEKEEALSIYMHKADPGCSSLPIWYNSTFRRIYQGDANALMPKVTPISWKIAQRQFARAKRQK